jgi:hypothetical protein
MLWGPAAGQQRSSELFSKATAMREDTSHHAANSTPAVPNPAPMQSPFNTYAAESRTRPRSLNAHMDIIQHPRTHWLRRLLTSASNAYAQSTSRNQCNSNHHASSQAAPDQGHAGARRHSEIAAAGHAVTAAATAALGSQHGVWTERHGHDRSTPRPFSSRETKSSSTAEATMEAHE